MWLQSILYISRDPLPCHCDDRGEFAAVPTPTVMYDKVRSRRGKSGARRTSPEQWRRGTITPRWGSGSHSVEGATNTCTKARPTLVPIGNRFLNPTLGGVSREAVWFAWGQRELTADVLVSHFLRQPPV